MENLSGKVAIVTGSSRGIGRSIAIRLAKEGVKVVVNGKKRIEEAKETLSKIQSEGGDGIITMADVSTRDGCKQLVNSAIENFGKLNILINNAGLGLFSLFSNADDNLIDKQINVTLKSSIYCTQEASKVIDKSKGGDIIFMSSIAGISPAVGLSFYGIAKAGLISLTKTLAIELSPIKVNSIAPGVVRTKMGESLISLFKEPEEEWAKKRTLLGRIVEPDEIAELIVTILKIPSITGQTFIIDSGQTLLGALSG
ncbi:3-oxoacyl-ACP reductase [Acidianus manzaensis]|uniref:3-oxoacyl-ACP reductase n=1 Tax=Acidianus manzaensis TaxID=282676 RepID=A0A1W6K3H2_9CREN|nr:3-oxoacyl-ACP reductase [Acidianus manzaensis]